jgi:hypothetical protein
MEKTARWEMTDRDRRVLANLSVPRSAQEVARLIIADANAPFDPTISYAQTVNEVSELLDDLEAAGLAKNIGVVDGAEHAVSVVADDDDVPTLHPEKAEQYQDRMTGKDSWKLGEGALWYFTAAGLEALTTG